MTLLDTSYTCRSLFVRRYFRSLQDYSQLMKDCGSRRAPRQQLTMWAGAESTNSAPDVGIHYYNAF